MRFQKKNERNVLRKYAEMTLKLMFQWKQENGMRIVQVWMSVKYLANNNKENKSFHLASLLNRNNFSYRGFSVRNVVKPYHSLNYN